MCVRMLAKHAGVRVYVPAADLAGSHAVAPSAPASLATVDDALNGNR